MKCFEIENVSIIPQEGDLINRKHEMFWNWQQLQEEREVEELTVNMKCFEIIFDNEVFRYIRRLTVNMKCFEISAL